MDNGSNPKIILYDHGSYADGVRPGVNAGALRSAAPGELEVGVFTHLDSDYGSHNVRGRQATVSKEGIRQKLNDRTSRIDAILIYEGAQGADVVAEEGTIALVMRDQDTSRLFVITDDASKVTQDLAQPSGKEVTYFQGANGYLSEATARTIVQTIKNWNRYDAEKAAETEKAKATVSVR